MDLLARLETHVQRGEFIQAIREGSSLLLVPDLTPKDLGRLYRLTGRARGESGDCYAALKLFELAIPWALQAKDWDTLGKARAETGVAWLTVGDVPNALESFQAFLLDLSHYTDAQTYLGTVYFNMGLAYRRKKNYPTAIDHYRKAVQCPVPEGFYLRAGKAHQNMAWLYLLINQPDEAVREIELAQTFNKEADPSFQVQQLVVRAHHLLVAKEPGSAMKVVEEVLQPGRPGAIATHRGYASWIAGVIAFRLRHYANARFFADLATQYALEAMDTEIMGIAAKLRTDTILATKALGEAAG